MVYHVTASPLGRLTELDTADAYQRLHNLPRLQFEDGDLVVQLGVEPRDWLVIHSKLFAAVSPVFGESWAIDWQEWASNPIVKHPRTGKGVAVRVLALTIIDDAFVLEGKTVNLHAAEGAARPVPFHISSIAAEGWTVPAAGPKTPFTATYDVAECARALRMFFSLAYGADLSMSKMTADIYSHRILADVCAYAEFWECTAIVKPGLTAALMAQDNAHKLWDAVAAAPKEYAILATKLGIPSIYYDAIRHLVGQAYAYDQYLGTQGYDTSIEGYHWAEIAELMDLEEDEVRNIFPWQLDQLRWDRAPPTEEMKLEGRGWYVWEWPEGTRCQNVPWEYPTWMAVPSRLPWNVEEFQRRVDVWSRFKGDLSVEDASEEWIGAIVEGLGGQ